MYIAILSKDGFIKTKSVESEFLNIPNPIIEIPEPIKLIATENMMPDYQTDLKRWQFQLVRPMENTENVYLYEFLRVI